MRIESRRLRALSVLTLVAAALLPTEATAQAIWDGSTSSDWFDAANWDGNAVPGAADDVGISTDTPYPTVIDGAAAEVDDLFVSYLAGTAALTIQDGGVLIAGETWIGYDAGATGVVTVDGAGSELSIGAENLLVGHLGTGSLIVTNGGHVDAYYAFVGREANSHGSVTIDGDGSFWYTHGGLTVGSQGTAEVTISNGGRAESGDVGIGVNANGTATVTGTGSTWEISGGSQSLFIADNADGALSILDHGLVTTMLDVELGTSVGAATLTMDPSGRLVVDSFMEFGPNATFAVSVTADDVPSGALIDATGIVTIDAGALVEVTAAPGNYASNSIYTLITADGGVNGAFGGVSSDLAYLDAALTYDLNNVYLALTRNDLAFSAIAETPNQIATADAVEAQGAGDAVYDAVVGLSTDEAQAAFDTLSGEGHASIKGAMIEQSGLVRDAVLGQLRDGFAAPGEGGALGYAGDPMLSDESAYGGVVWGQLYGGYGRLGSDGNAADVASASGGIVLGADGMLGDFRLGGIVDAGMTAIDIPDRATTGSSTDYGAGLYGGGKFGDTGFAFGAAFTQHDISTTREGAFAGFTDTLTADYGAATSQVFGELSHEIDFGAFALTPYGQLAHVSHSTEAFTEAGGTAALTSAANTVSATFATLGLRASFQSLLEGGGLLTATGGLGWQHAFAELPDAQNAFAGGSPFSVTGAPLAADALVVEAGLQVDGGTGLDLMLSYDGQIAADSQSHALKAGIGGQF